MKGDKKVIDCINARISEELTAISQYTTHAEMCDNWGYKKLHNYFMSTAKKEMEHLHRLIERVLFLEGEPEITLNKLHIGNNVKTMIENDLEAEKEAIEAYNKAVDEAHEVHDRSTGHLFKDLVQEEEEHLKALEQFQEQIAKIGLDNWLSTQI